MYEQRFSFYSEKGRRLNARSIVDVFIISSYWFFDLLCCYNLCRYYCFFFLLRVTLGACGISQARDRISQPAPQPQQCQIWATSVSYTTAHGNAGSSTHWRRPGIEPMSSWILVRLFSIAPQWELPDTNFESRKLYYSYTSEVPSLFRVADVNVLSKIYSRHLT